jgi:tetratricopeptide (TPR) repeat protein
MDRRTFGWLVVVVFELSAMVASPRRAAAESRPSAWQQVRNPRLREEYTLHVEARRALLPAGSAMQEILIQPLRIDEMILKLERVTARPASDVRLRFDLGELYESRNRHSDAVAVLVPALREAGNHPAAEDAWLALAYAYAKSDSPQGEYDAYGEYLRRSTDPRSRTTAELNRAEAAMRLGNLAEAIVGYREAFEHASQVAFSSGETATLAVWGLAVALDRQGDSNGASLATARALGLDHGMQLIEYGRNVFFVPEYERLWYLGLGALEMARAADASERKAAYAKAASVWQRYVYVARSDDRWLALAKAHAARAMRFAGKNAVEFNATQTTQ